MDPQDELAKNDLLKRAIGVATEATWLDTNGRYSDAVDMYQCAIDTLEDYVHQEECKTVLDCVMVKLASYTDRMRVLRNHINQHPQSMTMDTADGEEGVASTVAATAQEEGGSTSSFESGVFELDSAGGGSRALSSHNTSHDCASDECDSNCAVLSVSACGGKEPLLHQLQSRREFLRACELQAAELLVIIHDKNESAELRERAQLRRAQILEFAEAYRGDLTSPSSATSPTNLASTVVVGQHRQEQLQQQHTYDNVPGLPMSKLSPNRRVVRAEVSVSAYSRATSLLHLEQRAEDTVPLVDAEVASDDDGDEDYPRPPVDGVAELRSLQNSMESVLAVGQRGIGFVGQTSIVEPIKSVDTIDGSTDETARVRRVAVSRDPVVAAATVGVDDIMPAVIERLDMHVSQRLTKPSLFWRVLGSICG